MISTTPLFFFKKSRLSYCLEYFHHGYILGDHTWITPLRSGEKLEVYFKKYFYFVLLLCC